MMAKMQQANPPTNNPFLTHLIGLAYALYDHELGTLTPSTSPDLALLVNTLIQTNKIFPGNQDVVVTGEFCVESLRENPKTYIGLSPENAWLQFREWGVDELVVETMSRIMERRGAESFEETLKGVHETFLPPSRSFVNKTSMPTKHSEENDEVGIKKEGDGERVDTKDSLPSQKTNLDFYETMFRDPPSPTTTTFSNQGKGMGTLNKGFETLPVAKGGYQLRRRK